MIHLKWFAIFIVICINTNFINGQKVWILKGSLRDSISGEKLGGASIFISELSKGYTVNELGNFEIKLAQGSYSIEFKYLGYFTVTRKFTLSNNLEVEIVMKKNPIVIDEVSISNANYLQQQNQPIGLMRIGMKQIQNMPALFGEGDILKNIQTLPGIIPVDEGSSSIYVRGGSADQTLMLLDGANIINPSHIYGILSIFNPDFIKEIDIFKGGAPIEFGGKISSLVNIKAKDVDFVKFKTSCGIGLLTGRFTIEGPIIKNKLSFVASGRKSYANWIIKPVFKSISSNYSFDFYDLNGKLSFIDKKHKITISGYLGHDNFTFRKENNALLYGNKVVSNTWDYLVNSKLQFRMVNYYTNYNYNYEVLNPNYSHYIWGNTIEEVSSKMGFTYFQNSNTELIVGLNVTGYKFPSPQIKYFYKDTLEIVQNRKFVDRYAINYNFFSSYKVKLKRVIIDVGLRLNNYRSLGPGNVIRYNAGADRTNQNILDTLSFNAFQTIKKYYILEPRISINIPVYSNSTIKCNYSKSAQFYQQVSNYTANIPSDRWVLSDYYIKPQIGHQWSVGYFLNIKNRYQFSIETYYKILGNQIDVKTGAVIFTKRSIESELLHGKAYSYGYEVMLEKKVNKLTGWLSYSFLDSKRHIKGINSDRPYSPRFDIRHSFSIVANYMVSARIEASANFNFHTGVAVTLPDGVFEIEGMKALYYDPNTRNNDRMPLYHRLDLSMTINNKNKNNKKMKSKWVFSIYNAYAKKNPYFYTFTEPGDVVTGINYGTKIKTSNYKSKLTCLFYLIPSVSYSFSLNSL